MADHILALDLETTGLDAKTGSIIEIGAVHYNGHERIGEFQLKFPGKWGSTVSLGALKVNKRHIDTVRQYNNVENDEGLKKFVAWLLKEVVPKVGNKTFKIIGHNVAFDVNWLKESLEQMGIVGWSEIFNHSVKDSSVVGDFLRDCGILEMDKMSLENLAISLNIPVHKEGLHGALYDADLSVKCYFAMKDLVKKLVRANHGKSE